MPATFLQILFWTGVFFVFYSYIGYGMFLYIAIKIKAFLKKEKHYPSFSELPEVTLVIAAYNEEDIVDLKMKNCKALKYPPGRLQ